MKPMFFNTEMDQAILDGRKTATRRIVKGYIPTDAEFGYTAFTPLGCISCRGTFEDKYGEKFFKLPYQKGDILYVRETWAYGRIRGGTYQYFYKADYDGEYPIVWRPSIHMPKEVARIFLKVTDVRVERLQEMTEDDVIKEGADEITMCPNCYTIYFPDGGAEPCWNMPDSCKPCYMDQSVPESFGEIVWNNTISKKDRTMYGWDANPWVWVISFERINKND